MALNQVTIEGTVSNDFEVRKTNRNVPVVNFRLRHSKESLRYPLYIDVEVFAEEAEKFAKSAKRGSFVVVHAELRRDMWQNKDGENRSKIKLTASKIVFSDDVNEVQF